MDECMDERVDERVDECADERADERVGTCVDERADARVDERADARVDERRARSRGSVQLSCVRAPTGTSAREYVRVCP